MGAAALLGDGCYRDRAAQAQANWDTAPAFSIPGGAYAKSVLLELIPPWPGTEMRFTSDGSLPTPDRAARYVRPIALGATEPGVTVIRAGCVLPNGEMGPIATASYAVRLDNSLPILSLAVDPADLWDARAGIYQNPLGRGPEWERSVHATLAEPDGGSGFAVDAGLRTHGYQSRAQAKKSLRLYFRSEYGVATLDYPMFAAAEVTSFDRLVVHAGGQDYAYPPLANWTLLRNQLAAAIAGELGVAATHSRPALLFINGTPWGIYHIRERVDSAFLRDHYGLSSVDLLAAPESSLRDVLAGDRAHWDGLMQYVATHDLTSTEAYEHVRTQLDLDDFIDYTLLQIYSANTDWPAHNTHFYRPKTPGGRWRAIVWDSDNGFGADTYSQVDSDIVSHLLDYSHPETEGRDTLLFRKLVANRGFRERFLSRAEELLVTTLAPAHVIDLIDRLSGELAPDIAYETARWPTTSVWADHIQQLRDFAGARPDYVRQHLSERLGSDATGVTPEGAASP